MEGQGADVRGVEVAEVAEVWKTSDLRSSSLAALLALEGGKRASVFGGKTNNEKMSYLLSETQYFLQLLDLIFINHLHFPGHRRLRLGFP